jgi:hypothetical protein
MKIWFAVVVFVLAAIGISTPRPAVAEALAPPDQKRIEALIDAVGQSDAATFIRNGTSYDAKTAARFLRLKWQANAAKVHSVDEFIREIATRSGTSGSAYTVKLADGSEVESAQFLATLLANIPVL